MLLNKIKRFLKKKHNDQKDKGMEKKPSKKNLPDTPYGPKIASITDAGIEFYWKKIEVANGYEIFRSYDPNTEFEKIGEVNRKTKGEYIDSSFDHDKRQVYYKSRSYLIQEDGSRIYSDFTDAAKAEFREELTVERKETYMYDGASRGLRAFYGWNEATDVTWSSNDESVAKVNEKGMISAISTGVCILTCESSTLNQKVETKVVVNREDFPPLDTGVRRFSFNEEKQYWENKDAEESNDAVIMMVGDMMCGTAQTRRQYNEERGWSYNDSYEYVRSTTAQSDFAVGNLETLLAPGWPYMIDEGYINNKNNCNNPPRYLDAVLYGGFDAVMMSNNHNCDGGTRALQETIQQVDLRQIPRTGVFKNKEEARYIIINVNGIKVGYLAYMSVYTTFNGKDADWTKDEKDIFLNVFTKEKAIEDVKACRAAGAEYVIAYMHWGRKNYKNITKEQEKEAQEAADAGVDYIVGANPHVVQIYDELIAVDGRSVPCFYSVGNFQAYMNQIPGNRESALIRIRLKRDAAGNIVLVENNYIPYHTYKAVNGCILAPVALSQQYDMDVKKASRTKFYNRVVKAIGDKVSPL